MLLSASPKNSAPSSNPLAPGEDVSDVWFLKIIEEAGHLGAVIRFIRLQFVGSFHWQCVDALYKMGAEDIKIFTWSASKSDIVTEELFE